MNYPTVHPIRVTTNRDHPGAHVVTIRCPYCHRKHSHGLPAGNTVAGHRHSHCGRGNGYVIAAAEADR